MWSTIFGFIPAIIEGVSKWSERRDKLREAELEERLSYHRARSELAAEIVKADTEWDLEWARTSNNSWKDEWLLILWSIPMVAFLPALFFEGARGSLLNTLTFIRQLDENALWFYFGGWGVIFSAVFGLKAAAQIMLPGKVTQIANAFSTLEDDIPDTAVQGAAERISGKVRAILNSGHKERPKPTPRPSEPDPNKQGGM